MWSKLIGHSKQIDQLKKALASGRLASAYLFCGPRGIGKRLVADGLAMALACQQAAENEWDACGTCTGCRKSTGKNHPDQFTVEPEESETAAFRSIKIESIRLLQAGLQYHPLEAKTKIAIIDDADRMLEAAANSLLKILEEPPADTHFVLVSSLAHRLLPTIRSRCQHIVFQPIGETEMVDYLTLSRGTSASEVLRIARVAGGSIGTALALEPDFINSVLTRFLTITGKASAADILQTAEEWKGMEPRQTLLIFDLITSWYRDILLYHTTGDGDRLAHAEAKEAAGHISATVADRCLTELRAARETAETTANKQLMFEQLLFMLAGC